MQKYLTVATLRPGRYRVLATEPSRHGAGITLVFSNGWAMTLKAIPLGLMRSAFGDDVEHWIGQSVNLDVAEDRYIRLEPVVATLAKVEPSEPVVDQVRLAEPVGIDNETLEILSMLGAV